jgi:hypothetical protein
MSAGAPGGGDGGRMAQFVSNASFASLALIYTFTEVLDLSDKVGLVCAFLVAVTVARSTQL